jgi:glycosyltransferase involved in cell wall biosynthesis
MRIAVVNNFFPPRPGGSSHLADHLAKKYAAAGHEVLVLTAGYNGAPAVEERDGLRIVRIPSWTLPKTRLAANFDIAFTMSPRTRRQVFRLLDEFEPDVLHQHGQFFDLTWVTGWWARTRRVPTLLSIHTRLYSPNAVNNAIYRVADAVLVKPLMRVHRPRLVVMDVLMDRYIEQRYRGAFQGKAYIPVGIDPEVLRGGDAVRARTEHDLGDNHVLLSLGHVIPQRSRVALVKALPAVLRRFPNLIVVVIGGVYHDEFLTLATSLGVDHAIRAIGARPQSEIPDYLAAADLEVHELDGQGFGTASLESLAVGIPVVAAIRPDNFIEVVLEDEKHLFLSGFVSETDERADPASLADKLIEVLEDPVAARARVADNARAVIEEHFTIETVANRHLAVFDEMVLDRATAK